MGSDLFPILVLCVFVKVSWLFFLFFVTYFIFNLTIFGASPFFVYKPCSCCPLFVQVVVPCFINTSFTMDSWFRLRADVSYLLDDAFIDTAPTDTPVTLPGYNGAELRYPAPYNVKEYIRAHIPKNDARRFAVMPTGEMFFTHAWY